jgi:hypothetical protein
VRALALHNNHQKRHPALAFISNSQPLQLDQRFVYTIADNPSAFSAALLPFGNELTV